MTDPVGGAQPADPAVAAEQRQILSDLSVAAEQLLIARRKWSLALDAQTRAQQDYQAANDAVTAAESEFDRCQRAARSLKP